MKALNRYRLICNILASIGIIGEGIFYAITQPSRMDIISGAVCGLILYVIWFNKDKNI